MTLTLYSASMYAGGRKASFSGFPLPLSVANHVTATITSISDGSRIVSNAPAAEPATMAL
jgi:hypothetical protein